MIAFVRASEEAVNRRISMSILAISLSAHVLGAATLYRNPTVNGTHIVFEWAGDLWTVPRAGEREK